MRSGGEQGEGPGDRGQAPEQDPPECRPCRRLLPGQPFRCEKVAALPSAVPPQGGRPVAHAGKPVALHPALAENGVALGGESCQAEGDGNEIARGHVLNWRPRAGITTWACWPE